MKIAENYPLINTIDLPEDVRKLSRDQLIPLSTELREFLTHTVSLSGGHFSAGLGTVELTVALHYVYNTPKDQLVWDVGHQAYPHKILTGRKERMPTIRTKDGVSAFPKRKESEYDAFGVGHSSTSISAALGMAIAAENKGEDSRMVAIIGDGSITGGMAFEAMNHAGAIDANLLVILNDNDMAISPNVGAMNNYFTKIISSKLYSSVREESKKVLSGLPSVWELAKKTEEHVKGMIVPGTLFEELGFNYIGPIDGHDVDMLVETLQAVKELSGPVFLHIVTKKGKGYAPAEKDPLAYHGVPAFDRSKDCLPKSAPSPHPTYTQVFGRWLCDMAEKDQRLLGITPAMREGSGMVEFSECYPKRYFDVAIAEQHAVTLAAGQACQGAKPIVAIYSTFLQRAYDQLVHDVAIQNLDVLFAIDRAGLVGPDGPTHAGNFDYSFLRCIPNMLVMAPADENECRQMLTTGYNYEGPASVRYPRGKGPGTVVDTDFSELEIGKAEIRHKGGRMAILAWGSMVTPALEAGKQLGATVVNMRFIKPIDETIILEMAKTHDVIVTIEENVLAGGAGSAINEFLQAQKILMPVLNIALPDEFVEQGTREELLNECGLDTQGILSSIEDFCA
ncbi:1-deoxy-D-xylulose-5-phosphate synthase [Methylococcaceae bacterium CS1]|nr:1-deoxy-D-xylulose-5-phosphate synthase [Methyloprofundus sp.]TXK94695.1 1-deoxy-D-xylulose-5-phosphate synthase [Methylococcaceae bacterium CS4]TXK97908.1 1-deoxy-D-xylulose-5-phosphate synthase [Methylococcaceae bacterium CS5]TXL06807.1 1-deoxy-D-xylulose-5-phosphate synthase [Methylococcaceae bacterium CS1]TXL08690.1 1-deoxy-D-xylulose-5-phosphate synthase [Methylococcaceae bacterium CS3]TXL12310.1 1-deoxy-D-xylulose-5-phosphate synthase [Methylococcaceae bacterium CS2]